MAAWIVRHDEALLEAKRTLAEAIQEYGPGMQRAPPPPQSWRPSEYSTGRSYDHRGSSDSGPNTEATLGTASNEDAGNDEAEPTEGDEAWERSSSQSWSGSWWRYGYWEPWTWYHYGSHQSWGHQSGGSHASWDASEPASAQAEKFCRIL